MRKVLEPYPFPDRNKKISDDDIIYSHLRGNQDEAYKEKWHEIKTGNVALTYKLQYLNLENELIESFSFVHPSEKNSKTYSIKFSEVIKGSANLYEIISKDLYAKYFEYDSAKDKIDIFNYLSLDKFLQLSDMEVIPSLIGDKFSNTPELFKPFEKLLNWDKNSVIDKKYVPNWWEAYNHIKHSNEGLEKFAILENAISSVAANYLLLHKIYGVGLIFGELYPPKGQSIHIKTSELFSFKYL